MPQRSEISGIVDVAHTSTPHQPTFWLKLLAFLASASNRFSSRNFCVCAIAACVGVQPRRCPELAV